MPRIHTVKVFDNGRDARFPIYFGKGSYAADLARAVAEDHPHGYGDDDSTCDIEHALEAGAPLTAAGLLSGATECAYVDACIWAHAFNGTMTYDPRRNVYSSPDWHVWQQYHDENGRQCDACGAVNYCVSAGDTCGNCLAALPRTLEEDRDYWKEECEEERCARENAEREIGRMSEAVADFARGILTLGELLQECGMQAYPHAKTR